MAVLRRNQAEAQESWMISLIKKNGGKNKPRQKEELEPSA